jgi:hypothetical protein
MKKITPFTDTVCGADVLYCIIAPHMPRSLQYNDDTALAQRFAAGVQPSEGRYFGSVLELAKQIHAARYSFPLIPENVDDMDWGGIQEFIVHIVIELSYLGLCFRMPTGLRWSGTPQDWLSSLEALQHLQVSCTESDMMWHQSEDTPPTPVKIRVPTLGRM